MRRAGLSCSFSEGKHDSIRIHSSVSVQVLSSKLTTLESLTAAHSSGITSVMLGLQGYKGFESETGHLAAQVNQLSDQLHAAQAAAAAAQQEVHQLQCKQQVTPLLQMSAGLDASTDHSRCFYAQ